VPQRRASVTEPWSLPFAGFCHAAAPDSKASKIGGKGHSVSRPLPLRFGHASASPSRPGHPARRRFAHRSVAAECALLMNASADPAAAKARAGGNLSTLHSQRLWPYSRRAFIAPVRHEACRAGLFHGGGFMLGTLALYDTACRRLAVQGGCPCCRWITAGAGNQFPGAVLDAYAAPAGASDHAGLLNNRSGKDRRGRRQRRRQSAAVVAQMAQDSQTSRWRCSY